MALLSKKKQKWIKEFRTTEVLGNEFRAVGGFVANRRGKIANKSKYTNRNTNQKGAFGKC